MDIELAPRDIITVGVGLFLILLGASIGRGCGTTSSERSLTRELVALREKHEGVVTVRNEEIRDLRQLLDSKDKEIGVQADLILKLRDKPPEVRYIIKTVTIFEPIDREVTVAVKDLPPEKLFGFRALGDETIVTSRMRANDLSGDGIPDQVTFSTFPQTFTLDATLGKTSSSFLLRVTSEYDGEPHDVPVDVRVTRVNDHHADPGQKVVDPTLALGLGGFAGGDILSRDPVAGWTAGLSMPWLHPTNSVDLLSPSITLGTSWHPVDGSTQFVVRAGATIISYNPGVVGGGPLRDTWVGADVGIATDGGLSGGLVLSTRL